MAESFLTAEGNYGCSHPADRDLETTSASSCGVWVKHEFAVGEGGVGDMSCVWWDLVVQTVG